jgi:peptide/nickel transport system ATP-binding protein
VHEPLLVVDALSIAYATANGEQLVVRGLDLSIAAGDFVGLVGESGSGKTSVALAILNYLPRGGRIVAGDIRYRGATLLGVPRRRLQAIYGRRIAHVAQDPSSSLNPALRIAVQLEEGMARHLELSPPERRRRALALLDEVHLPGRERILEAYPHMLSGGMQQRVCIAMALACDPQLVVMDEPTTGLDAATEMGIFDLLRELKARRRLSVLFISHNLAAVGGMADRVAIMYGGRAMESGPTASVFARPLHRYTQLMLHALPTMRGDVGDKVEMRWQAAGIPRQGCPFRDRCDVAIAACEAEVAMVDVAFARRSACVRWRELPPVGASSPAQRAPAPLAHANSERAPVLTVTDLTHRYRAKRFGRNAASSRPSLDRVSFVVRAGEVLAVIGESGSGKTTLARCLVGLVRPLAGSIVLGDTDVAKLGRYPASIARHLQIVFQNIAGSLHPRKRVRNILERPYRLYERRHATDREFEELTHGVGLRTEVLHKRPGRLSGGERQRAAIARAFAPRPFAIVLDEAFSALDVSMKMKVRNLLLRKKAEFDASYLLITHDLPLVRAMADRVLVLYRGWVCEIGARSVVESPPYHPYTETLVWAALELEGIKPAALDRLRLGSNDAPQASTGCPFHPSCPRKLGSICESEPPPMQSAGVDHTIACHIPIAQLMTLQREEWRNEPVLETIR